MAEREKIERTTGQLFGDLWHRYGDDLFEQSVTLFAARLNANGFDLEWLRDKTCLDAGCGGGRYSIAMARFGAAHVVGCDISESGLRDAEKRAAGLPAVQFRQASVLDLPFADETFDFCWCAGVLHHTIDPDRGLDEVSRVLKQGGKLFLLLYGKGGVRWPTIMKLRPLAHQLGYEHLDTALKAAGMPANKQRTFLDDLFVPEINFYDWPDIESRLRARGYRSWHRFEKAQLDHESSPEIQRIELVQLRDCFIAAGKKALSGVAIVDDAISELDRAELDFRGGKIDAKERDWRIFGWGHHRLIADK
jgi:SAM-dependent methyltransferase